MDCSVALSPMTRMSSPQCSLVYRMVSLLINSTQVFLCYALRLDDDLKFLTKLCDLWISKLSSNRNVSLLALNQSGALYLIMHTVILYN